MLQKKTGNLIVTGIWVLLFILFTVLVQIMDVNRFCHGKWTCTRISWSPRALVYYYGLAWIYTISYSGSLCSNWSYAAHPKKKSA